MIPINFNILHTITKDANAKINAGIKNTDLYSIYASAAMNYNDSMRDETEYEMGNWIEHVTKWIRRKAYKNKTKYGRGTIVMVDLGATNYGSEPSYAHPAVIIAENTLFALVVPGSSKKYGKGYTDIIDADTTDGFSTKTGVQSKSYRWISKNRIDCVMGKASSWLLDEIDERILKDIPTYRKIVGKYNAEIKQISDEKEKLEKELAECKKIIEANKEAVIPSSYKGIDKQDT